MSTRSSVKLTNIENFAREFYGFSLCPKAPVNCRDRHPGWSARGLYAPNEPP